MQCNCYICNEPCATNVELEETLYDHPSDADGEVVQFCSQECAEQIGDGDFGYMTCGSCERMICLRNPNCGWEVQVHYDEDSEELLCTDCYAHNLLQNGQDASDFANEQHDPLSIVAGGTWISPQQLREHGYMLDQECLNVRIANAIAARGFNRQALNHIKAGKQVVTVYGAMGIGGLEGYVSLAVK